MKNILQSSYYRTDIPAVKQFTNQTREVLSLKTNDIQGAIPKSIYPERVHKADTFIEDYLRNEKNKQAFTSPSKNGTVRNPFYSDCSYYCQNDINTDALDLFQQEYEEKNKNNEVKANDIEKNMALFYGVTPPPTGTKLYSNILDAKKNDTYNEKFNATPQNIRKEQSFYNKVENNRDFAKDVANFYGATPQASKYIQNKSTPQQTPTKELKHKAVNFYGVSPPASFDLKDNPENILVSESGKRLEKNEIITKDYKCYKMAEDKYRIYNPLSGKRDIEYVPKYQFMVQVEDLKNNYKFNDELSKKYHQEF